MTEAAPALACTGLRIGYGPNPVVTDVDLTVAAGEVVALLGPSGSGKTTLLSAVAGFLNVAAGEIRIDGELVEGPGRHVPPERRSVAVVFQSYALWPHMTALETVAYPYRRRGIAVPEARRRAADLLERLGIGGLAARRPAELSGGEQQRVGLGRALARDARLSLFDEPTAHLDATLRTQLQAEIAAQRRTTGAAALYATHDTAEALAVADRVALLRAGRLVQVGAPAEVYERPVDVWAARLTGPASLLAVTVRERRDGRARIDLGGVAIEAAVDGVDGTGLAVVRPEWARLGGDLPGRIATVAYRGLHTEYGLETPAGTIGLYEPGPPRAAPGDGCTWRLERAWLVGDAEAGADPAPFVSAPSPHPPSPG
jgi:ABC-type Fe3+/spermidine/putrescine transport system ATPase subunit